MRDLLFARLLQYRAFKRVAEMFAGQATALRVSTGGVVGETEFVGLLPEVMLGALTLPVRRNR